MLFVVDVLRVAMQCCFYIYSSEGPPGESVALGACRGVILILMHTGF